MSSELIVEDNIICTDTNINAKKYSINDKKKIVKTIEELNKIQHIEIFKLLRKNSIKFTENSNGIFINFNTLDDILIEEIENLIKFCLISKEELKKKEIKVNESKNFITKIEESDQDLNSSSSESDISEDLKKTVNKIEKEIGGRSIDLRQSKPTYTGIKAKIIKNYKVGSKNNK